MPAISQGIADAKRVGGVGSMLAAMTQAYRNADNFGEVWYLPLADDPAAQPGEASVTFTANASDSGVLALYIAGVLVSLAVLPSHAPGALATALTAKINAAVDLPVTAKVDSTTPGKVNLTAKNKGLAASDIDVRLNYLGNAGGETLPAGLGVTLTPMSGGQLNPAGGGAGEPAGHGVRLHRAAIHGRCVAECHEGISQYKDGALVVVEPAVWSCVRGSSWHAWSPHHVR